MQALLLIAHGSRRQSSNEEVKALTQGLMDHSDQEFSMVECAFLELATPSILDGISTCVTQGATSVTALPYFLSAGRHVATDVPEELAKARLLHPGVEIKTAPYLGSAKEISAVLMALSKQAS